MKLKLLSGILILGMILGSVITFAFFKPEKEYVDVEISAQILSFILSELETTQKIIKGIKFPTKYIIKTETDTIPIDSTTLYGNIPVVETSWDSDSSLVLFINGLKKRIDVFGKVTARGDVFNVVFGLYQTKFKIKVDKPDKWDFDLLVGSWIDQNYKWHGALMIELWYKKFALDAQMRVEPVKREENTEYQIKFLAGMVYEIL